MISFSCRIPEIPERRFSLVEQIYLVTCIKGKGIPDEEVLMDMELTALANS